METSYSNQLVERNRVYIFDTTLRDGEQSAFCTMYKDEKIEVAKKLEELGVDVIEAGFAASRQSDLEIISEISSIVKKPYLCSLARCKKGDIDLAYGALKNYNKRMIHIFIPTSEVQVFGKMKKDYETIEKMVGSSIRYATRYFDKIEFSCEDATRTKMEVLKKIYGIAIDNGATIINIPDTVGQTYPQEYFEIVKELTDFANSKNQKIITSVHCHNDLGLSTINSLYGISGGARQVECTINGIGERAGNCSLQEIIAHEKYRGNFYTNINSKGIKGISRIVEEYTGTERVISPLGRAAFSHKAGIHQHGVAMEKTSYEILNAEEFGMESEIVIGPHSGYHGVMRKAEELGFKIEKEQAEMVLSVVAERVKNRKQKNFTDADLEKIMLGV